MWFGPIDVAKWSEHQRTSNLRYWCERCAVWGAAETEEALTCWCCERGDSLKRGLMPMVKDSYTGRLTPASYDRLEEADRLVA